MRSWRTTGASYRRFGFAQRLRCCEPNRGTATGIAAGVGALLRPLRCSALAYASAGTPGSGAGRCWRHARGSRVSCAVRGRQPPSVAAAHARGARAAGSACLQEELRSLHPGGMVTSTAAVRRRRHHPAPPSPHRPRTCARSRSWRTSRGGRAGELAHASAAPCSLLRSPHTRVRTNHNCCPAHAQPLGGGHRLRKGSSLARAGRRPRPSCLWH